MPKEALELIQNMLKFMPKSRIEPLQAMGHPFFASLRNKGARLPNGRPFPPLFNFTAGEVKLMKEDENLAKYLLPCMAKKSAKSAKRSAKESDEKEPSVRSPSRQTPSHSSSHS